MSDTPQPELRWAPIPPKPKNRARIWIIIGSVILAVAIVAALLWFFLLRGNTPGGAPTPDPSSSQTASPTPSNEPSPGASATPSQDPGTPPVIPAPELDAFVTQVQPRLDDGIRGLDMLAQLSGQDAVGVVDQLQQDAQRLAETTPPSSISDAWFTAVSEYSSALTDVRAAAESGGNTADAVTTARERLQPLRDLVEI
ncbi:hypothetical protein ACFY9N_06080 [Microbacterium sp. NPDC008134]|uniref:hypothetical protein n=1 Tax=Microbacterium sp. NPDC008134 TaxID=3364183 RepID=UPI0036EBF05D